MVYTARLSSQITQLTVFIASPNDVVKERDVVRNVCAELNASVAPFRSVSLNPVGWETHCWPDAGGDSQAVILSQIQPEDIFVGILWNQFGTATPRAASGTVEEFAVAYKNWQTNNVSHLLFYFKKPTLTDNLDNLRQVQDFKKSIAKRGLLYWEFSARNEFERYIRQHLTNIVLRRAPVPSQNFQHHLSIDLAQLTRELDAQLLIDANTDLIYIDLDNFSRLNQHIGIPKADEVLISIGKIILAVCKLPGLVAHRVLGDQFAVFVPTHTNALDIAEELRKRIEQASTQGVTASIGVALNNAMDAETMILTARYAAHISKREGKNRVTEKTQVIRPLIKLGDFESS